MTENYGDDPFYDASDSQYDPDLASQEWDETSETASDDPLMSEPAWDDPALGDDVPAVDPAADDGLDAWLAEPEPDDGAFAAEPDTVGALGEGEFDAWLGDAFASGGPAPDAIVNAVLQRRAEEA